MSSGSGIPGPTGGWRSAPAASSRCRNRRSNWWNICARSRRSKKEITMLKVWGRRSSYNVQKVMWLIGELDLAHEHINAGGSAGGLDAPAFLAMNPHGRVPVIRDGDVVVWESHAILRYLAARHGAGRFWSD